MAIAYFQHTNVGKSTQAQPYTAKAHWNYITRPSAMFKEMWGNLPFKYNRHAVTRWLSEQEDALRKNGRVCDKLIIALPREMDLEQAAFLVRSYMNEISSGKAPWVATLHDWDSHNPHCHIIYVDRDADGVRVFKTSDKGSTERLKSIWEDTTNAHLEAHGIDASIQFGKTVTECHDLPEPTHDPYYDEPLRPVTPLDIDEEDVEIDGEEIPMTVLERTRTALSYHRELNTLRDARQRLSDLRGLTEEARQRLEQATQVATQKEIDALHASLHAEDASRAYHQYVNPDGSHRGFEVKVFGKSLFTSPTRKAALSAQENAGEATYSAMLKKAEAMSAAEARVMQDVTLHQFEEQAERVSLFVRTYGEEHELDGAETTMAQAQAYALDGVTIMDLQLAYEAGDMRADEYEKALRVMGYSEMAEEFSASLEVDPF